jgi:hypothetical protein
MGYASAGVPDVGRKPKGKAGPAAPEPKQYNVKIDGPTAARLDATARGLGLDGANFIRMVLRENLPKYERRVEAIGRGETPED